MLHALLPSHFCKIFNIFFTKLWLPAPRQAQRSSTCVKDLSADDTGQCDAPGLAVRPVLAVPLASRSSGVQERGVRNELWDMISSDAAKQLEPALVLVQQPRFL